MAKELFDEQKEDLFNLMKNGCTDENIRDYCAKKQYIIQTDTGLHN